MMADGLHHTGDIDVVVLPVGALSRVERNQCVPSMSKVENWF